MVGGDQVVLHLASFIRVEPLRDEVGHVPQSGPVPRELPVDEHDLVGGTCLAEQEVLDAEVTVHQRRRRCGAALKDPREVAHQPLPHRQEVRVDPRHDLLREHLPAPLHQRRVQLGLPFRGWQPRGCLQPVALPPLRVQRRQHRHDHVRPVSRTGVQLAHRFELAQVLQQQGIRPPPLEGCAVAARNTRRAVAARLRVEVQLSLDRLPRPRLQVVRKVDRDGQLRYEARRGRPVRPLVPGNQPDRLTDVADPDALGAYFHVRHPPPGQVPTLAQRLRQPRRRDLVLASKRFHAPSS